MADRVNPHWLKLGSQIRLLREAQGLSQAQLSQALNISQAMLSAVERGIRNCKPDLAAQIDHVLNTGGKVRRLWEINHTNSAFPHWFRDIVQLQRAASEIWEFQIALIPGLLQTKEYARTRIQLSQPTASVEEIDQKVRARLDRQST
ncbi:helix-turn-helix motif [Thermobifida fusca YX]|uniref:Helix-turn-helix motif n=1 Tax=Thermobifida fusca (strain YX) TaxID=269800 RepID=Q47TB5_THEFY|nr:helix-turn-helix motif [Thermobifida fusca YX]